jgi:hypothetical protein
VVLFVLLYRGYQVTSSVSSGGKAIGRQIGMLASSFGGFFDNSKTATAANNN